MALPRYKLHTEALPDAPASYPVLLAPAEEPNRFGFLKKALTSKKLIIGLQIISFAAFGTLLWLMLDPTIKSPQPMYVLAPAITLAVCVALFIIISIVKNRAEEQLPAPVEARPKFVVRPIVHPVAKPKRKSVACNVELNFEQWTSEPFREIMDEAVVAEVFTDDLVAPDKMVFSIKVEE